MKNFLIGMVCIVWIACSCQGADYDTEIASMVQDVDAIGISGVPGPICVFGEKAFTVITAEQSKEARLTLVAAAEYGKGRVVAFGHDGYLNPQTLAQLDTLQFLKNSIRWTTHQKADPVVGVYRNNNLVTYLNEHKLNAQNTDLSTTKEIDVLILAAGNVNPQNIAILDAFVSEGGALITAGLGWGWKQLNPGKSLENDFAANQLLAPMGMVWADGYAGKTTPDGYLVEAFDWKFLNASTALEAALAQSQKPDIIALTGLQVGATLAMAIRSLPDNDTILLPKIRQLEKQFSENYVISTKEPLNSSDILGRLFVTLQVSDSQKLPPDKIIANPSAQVFPGAVPDDAPRIGKMLEIDTSIPRWHSTGLYAAPGEIITVDADSSVVNKGINIRIGAHTDQIWRHDQWNRFPQITRTFSLDQTKTTAANAFGGLVYIEVPNNCPLGKIKLSVNGAVEAPYYVHGQTDLKTWCESVRNYPAPWAELASDRIILTVPSANIRNLDDPSALMKVWNEILDACADLASISRKRSSPERIVPDVQISAGYMHSGYPIMTYADQYDNLVNKEHLLEGNWGLFHEIGHNHQNGDWTFNGTGEVTVNLFTTYVYDTVCGVPPAKGRVPLEQRKQEYEKYVNSGRDFEKWKNEPFLALVMYLQLQQQFGWDTYKKLFAEYRALEDNERPKNDAEKRDQWLVRCSKATGYNLGPFFDAWNIPVSEEAKREIAHLPIWLPDDLIVSKTTATE